MIAALKQGFNTNGRAIWVNDGNGTTTDGEFNVWVSSDLKAAILRSNSLQIDPVARSSQVTDWANYAKMGSAYIYCTKKL